MSRFNIDISKKGSVERAKKRLEKMAQKIEYKMRTLVDKLAEIGVTEAKIYFDNAIYAGDLGQITVGSEEKYRGRTYKVVVYARGEAVAFIEYGTGVSYVDDHPDKDSKVTPRGQYGKGKGSNPKGWVYEGSLGSLSPYDSYEIRPGVVHTKGSPANMSMYRTRRDVENRVEEIVRSVFND